MNTEKNITFARGEAEEETVGSPARIRDQSAAGKPRRSGLPCRGATPEHEKLRPRTLHTSVGREHEELTSAYRVYQEKSEGVARVTTNHIETDDGLTRRDLAQLNRTRLLSHVRRAVARPNERGGVVKAMEEALSNVTHIRGGQVSAIHSCTVSEQQQKRKEFETTR